MLAPPAPEHDEQDETNAEASAELLSEGVTSHRSEEERITEAQKNERVKKQLQVELPHGWGGTMNIIDWRTHKTWLHPSVAGATVSLSVCVEGIDTLELDTQTDFTCSVLFIHGARSYVMVTDLFLSIQWCGCGFSLTCPAPSPVPPLFFLSPNCSPECLRPSFITFSLCFSPVFYGL